MASIYPILEYPDPKLREEGDIVEDFGPETQQIIDKMIKTLYASENCAALAAVQLGICKRITVIDISQKKDDLIILVNPEITHIEGQTNTTEGCMSIGHKKNIWAKVKRTDKIHVKAKNRHGEPIEFEAEGFLSKCIQHETDHLHGKLYLDHLPALKRKLLEKQLKRRSARSR